MKPAGSFAEREDLLWGGQPMVWVLAGFDQNANIEFRSGDRLYQKSLGSEGYKNDRFVSGGFHLIVIIPGTTGNGEDEPR